MCFCIRNEKKHVLNSVYAERNKITERPRNIDLVSIRNISTDFQIVVYLSDWFLNLTGPRFTNQKHLLVVFSLRYIKKACAFLPWEFPDFRAHHILDYSLQIDLISFCKH